MSIRKLAEDAVQAFREEYPIFTTADLVDFVEAIIAGRDQAWIDLMKQHGIVMETLPNENCREYRSSAFTDERLPNPGNDDDRERSQ